MQPDLQEFFSINTEKVECYPANVTQNVIENVLKCNCVNDRTDTSTTHPLVKN